MRRSLTWRALVAVAATAVLVLAGCSTDEESSSTSGSDDHNTSDVAFAQDMIPHHQQALLMAEVAVAGAETDELRQLAKRIQAAQAPEIELMSGWLAEWGEDVPDLDDMSHMMMGHGSEGSEDANETEMPGMMSADQLSEMRDAMGSGVAFDRMWVLMMIEHHEGAIEMARDQQASGQSQDAITLAADIEAAQTAEIEEMQQLLDEWSRTG